MQVITIIHTPTDDEKFVKLSYKSTNKDKEIHLGSLAKFGNRCLIPLAVIQRTLYKIHEDLFDEATD